MRNQDSKLEMSSARLRRRSWFSAVAEGATTGLLLAAILSVVLALAAPELSEGVESWLVPLLGASLWLVSIAVGVVIMLRRRKG